MVYRIVPVWSARKSAARRGSVRLLEWRRWQNMALLERTVHGLEKDGFTFCTPAGADEWTVVFHWVK